MKHPALALTLTLPCLLLTPPPGTAQDAEGATPKIREWEVPWEGTRPRDPYVAPDGRVWFVGQRGDYVAVFDPETEEFERVDLPAGAGPHTVVVDDRGRPWYAGNHAANIGRIDPESGDIELYPMPDPAARDPHTMTFGADGSLWFTVQGGNFVGRLSPGSGEIDLVPVPTEGARPYAIVTAADGALWVALFGTHKLARVDPKTRQLEEIELPRPEARPRRLGLTRDGAVWYTDYAEGYLDASTPRAGRPRSGAPRAVPTLAPTPSPSTIGIASGSSRPDRSRTAWWGSTPSPTSSSPSPRSPAARGRCATWSSTPRNGSSGSVPMRTRLVGRLSRSVPCGERGKKLTARDTQSGLSLWATAVGLTVAAAFLMAPPRPGAAYVEDPAPGHTGGFGEPTCQACHFGEASNDATGALRLEGAPERTEPGATHRLTVVLEQTGSERGGFQLAARFADGTPAGKLEPVDARARVTRVEETGLAYAHHTPQGTRTQERGTFRWQLRWTAPDEPSGRIVFHLTANASNDDDSPFGDTIYSAEAETVVSRNVRVLSMNSRRPSPRA